MSAVNHPTKKSSESTTASDKSAGKVPNLADLPAVVDRRNGLDRRDYPEGTSPYKGPERRVAEKGLDTDETGLHVRRGAGIRRSDDRRSAEEGEMTGEQFEFVMAVEAYKKANKRMYPTWTEILEVFSQLGYRKVLARTVELVNVPEPTLFTPETTPPTTSEKKAA